MKNFKWNWDCEIVFFAISQNHCFAIFRSWPIKSQEARGMLRFKNLPEIEIFEIFQQSENAILQVAQSVAI